MMAHASIPLPDNGELRQRLRDALADNAAAWLETRRWFADKGRVITSVELVDLLIDHRPIGILTLVAASVAFSDGDTAHYFLPLALVTGREVEGAIAAVPLSSGVHSLVDATETAWFGDWLLTALAAEHAVRAATWEFASSGRGTDLIPPAIGAPATMMRAEQSNTSIRFGDALIAKVVRRLQPEPNPEEEVLLALSAARFPRVPAYAGSGSWTSPDGTRFPIVLAQAFVPNRGDGWTWMLSRLRTERVEDSASSEYAAERLLGQRTAELHRALSRVHDDAFAPESMDRAHVDDQIMRTQNQVEGVIELLRQREESLPPSIGSRLDAVIAGLRVASDRVAGFGAEEGYPRIRVHGDFHLGQTLRTIDDDWTIIDFEGEPARPVSERRQKASALKDVAGMLRSFAYARGAVERETPASDVSARAARWEQGARLAFLAGYRETLRQSGERLVPESDAEFDRALGAWELDKALYEIAYEARNRPDWLGLPIRSLLPGIMDQPPAAAGAAPA